MLTSQRIEELRVLRERLMFIGNSLQMKYQGQLSMYNAMCQTGTKKEVELQRELTMQAAGEILDNMYAQVRVARELAGMPVD
jgi:hypothetical protein